MPTIRFVREGRDVKCSSGANLRQVALREGLELYGLKGNLGNCRGCGQCITCFVGIIGDNSSEALSPPTAVETEKLKRRPKNWRLACQTLVKSSVIVLTRPQVALPNSRSLIESAKAAELPQ